MSRFDSRPLAVAVLCLSIAALSACSATGALPRADGADAGKPSSAARVQANKRNAVAFYNQFFNSHDLSAADRYIGDSYTQHNPRVPNGKAAFVDAFRKIFAENPGRQSTIVRVIAEGDLVALHVHSANAAGERGSAIVDIFRFDEGGKIVEHWDVIQPIPESTASGNSMF